MGNFSAHEALDAIAEKKYHVHENERLGCPACYGPTTGVWNVSSCVDNYILLTRNKQGCSYSENLLW